MNEQQKRWVDHLTTMVVLGISVDDCDGRTVELAKGLTELQVVACLNEARERVSMLRRMADLVDAERARGGRVADPQYKITQDATCEKVGGAHVYNVFWDGIKVGVATKDPARGGGLSTWDVEWDDLADSPSGLIGSSWVRGTLSDLRFRLEPWSIERNKREERARGI